jgi:ribonuclease D
MADWSQRPLSLKNLEYAANDSYFLGNIASKQIQQVLAAKSSAEIEAWLTNFNSKV